MRRFYLLLMALVINSRGSSAILRVNDDAPGPGHDGASWQTAFLTVHEACSAATADDEIWVAAGVYTGPVILKAGISLYGGFAGAESARDERNWAVNEAVLDLAGGALRWQPEGSGLTGPRILDGFVLRNGSTTGPSYGHVTVAHCTLLHFPLNASDGSGGFSVNECRTEGSGISVAPYSGHLDVANSDISGGHVFLSTTGDIVVSGCHLHAGNLTVLGDASATVAGNIIEGGGIEASGLDGPALIAGNTVRGPASVGISAGSGSVTRSNAVIGCTAGVHTFAGSAITGNTFLRNATALQLLQSNTLVAGNIIAFNTMAGANDRSEFRNNCFWRNTTLLEDPLMPNPIGVNGNISADPLLADPLRGDVHIQPSSPCRDAGDDASASGTDLDGQPRVLGTHTDIGADESDGSTWSREPYVIKVKTTGDDLNDGLTWATALKTVEAAAAFGHTGDEAWVALGRYSGKPTLRGIALYGGFQGTETDRTQRNPASFISLLDTGADAQGPSGVIDGFSVYADITCGGEGLTLRNTYLRASLIGGGFSTLEALNCRILSGGIKAHLAAALRVENCEITDSPARGIDTIGDVWVEIRRNRLLRCRGGGIYLHTALHPVVEGNTITDCHAAEGAGIWCGGEGLRAWNNLIARNTAEGKGGGIYVATVSHDISGNTLVSNAAAFGGGMAVAQGQVVFNRSIANNIVAFNTSGLWRENGPDPVFTCNDVYGSVGQDYDGFTNPTGSNGNISVDPLFVDRTNWNYHLAAGSPCINAGSNGLAAGSADFEGDPRIVGGAVDIGADEYQPATYSVEDVVRAVRVAAGLTTALTGDIKRLNLVKSGASAECVTLEDAEVVARKAAGTEPNP
jgi:predicted outer membrane repeat protein